MSTRAHGFEPMGCPFEQALTTALEIAVTSPSSHNCQPWAVARLTSGPARRRAAAAGPSAAGDDVATPHEFLVLASERNRELRALPAHRAEMRISCGLFWHLLRRALAAQGWTAEPAPMPTAAELREVGLPPTWTPLRLARFRRSGEMPESLDGLRTLARRRQTNRGPYGDRPVTEAVLNELAGRRAGAEPRIHIRHLRSDDERQRFARFVARHGGRDFAHRDAWRETHSFIRPTESEAAASGDGFALTHLFGPLSPAQRRLRRVVLAPPIMAALRVTGFPRVLSGQLAAVVRRSPVIVSMSLPDADGTDSDMIAAGEVLSEYWLRATGLGLVLHPISVVVQHGDLRRKLQAEFDLPGGVFFIARLGYPTMRFPPSPRHAATASLRAL